MVNTRLRAAGYRPTCQDTNRPKKLPLLDRLGRLPENEVRDAIGLFCRGDAEANYRKFMTLREHLQKRGVHINIGRGMDEHSSVGIGVAVYCEFTTDKGALDARIRSEVEGMGFDLVVNSRPVLSYDDSVMYECRTRQENRGGRLVDVEYYERMNERTYQLVATSLTSNVSNVIKTAEKLVELTDMLQSMFVPVVSACDNVVELTRTTAPEPRKSGIRVIQGAAVKEAAEA